MERDSGATREYVSQAYGGCVISSGSIILVVVVVVVVVAEVVSAIN